MCESLLDELEKRHGSKDYVTIFDMPVQYITLPKPKVDFDYSIYHDNMDKISFLDEWGVGHQYGSVGHFTHFHSPMANFETVQEVLDYPYPNILNEKLWVDVKKQVEKAHAEGRASAFFAIQVFEPAWYLRGLDNLLSDMLVDEDMAKACMDKMCAIQCEIAKKAAATGVDIIVFGDDVGAQNALMMSKETWRKWVKPATKATIDAAKAVNPNILAFYHSDGTINDIIEELIEIGVDILNPIQPECMDPIEIKRQYGDRLSFWGTIGTQTTMPFGSPADVRESVKNMIETVGKGGGLCIAPTHLLEPEVPWENIMAFIDAVREFGSYS